MSNPSKPSEFSFLKLAGPGLVVAATGIGSGDVVSATVGGARYGVVLLWAILAGAFFKFVLSEGIARWQLATGKTALEGWADHLPPWVTVWFGVYLVVWTVAVSAAMTNATGLGIDRGHLVAVDPAATKLRVMPSLVLLDRDHTVLNFWQSAPDAETGDAILHTLRTGPRQ